MSTKQKPLSEEMADAGSHIPAYEFADAVRALEAELEQALLDRDTLKAATLQLARERDAALAELALLKGGK